MKKDLTLEEIIEYQNIFGVSYTQNLINNGRCWLMEGNVGRFAMDCLKSGICYLPEKNFNDYYGSRIPNRNELVQGSTGTLTNSINFWNRIAEGNDELEQQLIYMFGEYTESIEDFICLN